MVVMICRDCPRFQISPGALIGVRGTLTAARVHCSLTGHSVSVNDGAQVLVYERLGETVLCEKHAELDAA